MGTFISGGSTLANQPKVDLISLPSGANPVNFGQAADWNQIYNALLDVQSWERGGAAWRGISAQAADPAPSGISNYLWQKSDNTLYLTTPSGAIQQQPHVGRRRRIEWLPNVNNASVTTIGCVATAALGGNTVTARTKASTSFYTQAARVGYVSPSSASSLCGTYDNTANHAWLGNAAGLGGFYCAIRWAVGDAAFVSTGQTFVGLAVSGALSSSANPSTFTNLIGMGNDATDTVMQAYGSGSSAQARVSLGSSFPNTASQSVIYELIMYAAPNASSVAYQVTNLNTGVLATGTWSGAQLPSNTTFLTPYIWRSNGSTATAVAIDLCSMYLDCSV